MRQRVNKRDEDTVPTWQTIYCSLILIMLVLFVMLVSYSVSDKGKMTNLKGNFEGYATPQGGSGMENYVSFRYETIPLTTWIKDAMDVMGRAGTNAGLEGAVKMEAKPGGLRFRLNSDALFPPGQAVIRVRLYPYLDELIRVARGQGLSLSIEGHTDNFPLRSETFPSNWELSAAQAASLLRYCLEKGQIPADRLSAAGFGPYRPLVPNDTIEGRMRNRRIEVLLVKALL